MVLSRWTVQGVPGNVSFFTAHSLTTNLRSPPDDKQDVTSDWRPTWASKLRSCEFKPIVTFFFYKFPVDGRL